MTKRALITGVTGQDGAYLSKHLLDLGYEVFGGIRCNSSGSAWRLERLGIADKVKMVRLDVTDINSVSFAVKETNPDEIYNLAAQGHVGDSWAVPIQTREVNYSGADNVFMCSGNARVFQASTGEFFGGQPMPVDGFTESAQIKPETPYGIAKAAAHFSAQMYRKKGKYISTGIMFNHESPLRQDNFVTQRIAKGVRKWRETGESFTLFDVKGERDWGWAPDFVRAMHLSLQQENPDDYIFATGQVSSVLDFLQAAVGETLRVDDSRVVTHRGSVVVTLTGTNDGKSPRYFGNPRKAAEKLGWRPEVYWGGIAERMVNGV